MGGNLIDNKKCNVSKGDIFFRKGDIIRQIAILVSGHVKASNTYTDINLQSGALLGALDTFGGEYIFNYEALTDVTLLLFEYAEVENIKAVFELGVSYQELAVTSVFKQYQQLIDIYTDRIEPHVKESFADPVDNMKCQYINEIIGLKKELYHGIFTLGDSIPYMHMLMVMDVVKEIHQAALSVIDILVEENRMEESSSDNTDDYKETVPENTAFSEEQIKEAVDVMRDTLSQILGYAEVDAETAQNFTAFLAQYRGMTNADPMDMTVRAVRNKISNMFYEIYELVFFKSLSDDNYGRVIELFLNYGFMDESGFDRDKLAQLYFSNCVFTSATFSVYTIYEWLKAIYNGKREPSKNEYDLDYKEHLRDLKKSQKFTQEEENSYLTDQNNKVHFEIKNLFKVTNRMTSGEISRFCPVLNPEALLRDLNTMAVNAKRIEKAFAKIMDVDYSLFYREQMYYDVEHKINKAYIMKEVLPDIILMPNVGSKGVMWQEISDSKRDYPGRMVFSIFTSENIDKIFTNTVAAFRWELCRTIQGTHWNDIRERSLTSEYCDYVQFYRKNKELTEDAKNKIKAQYQSSKNSYREMFVKDYSLWLNYEAFGAIRLNKCARRILYLYCPFAKKYRDKVLQQPVFAEIGAEFARIRNQKIKDIKGQYKNIENNGGEIIDILKETLDFYEEK